MRPDHVCGKCSPRMRRAPISRGNSRFLNHIHQPMLILPGGPALSDFRIKKLLAVLRSAVPEIETARSYYVHFAELDGELDAAERSRLTALLNYGAAGEADSLPDRIIIIPRPGTISPWSSKASDIIRHCGLGKLGRIERGRVYLFGLHNGARLDAAQIARLKPLLHDRMTESALPDIQAARALFKRNEPAPLRYIDMATGGLRALHEANGELGLALSAAEMDYLFAVFSKLGRDPSDVELMMFAQANSEHCRHKIFNAAWRIDDKPQPRSPFQMIRQTRAAHPGNVLSAYHDNAAVMRGYRGARFFAAPGSGKYVYRDEEIHILAKVETHNHPTAISPRPGAATGAGGEIRDEAATGRGAKPKAGLTGFAVSNLKIPGFIQPWEKDNGKPDHIASALAIMLEAPLGAAGYNNEFGRPALCGYFRSYEQALGDGLIAGYHKPVMLAGGYGMIRGTHIEKQAIPGGAKLIVLGGPAMLIGLGGGAASSLAAGSQSAALDFASVQRDNAEMQRRCQEVIDRCGSLGADNPILSIHDVGAGGLSNALPELVHASGRGAELELRNIPNAEPGMSPLGIWCNEAQERYVLAIGPEHIERFAAFCRQERAPFAILGEATEQPQLALNDRQFATRPVAMPMSALLGKPPRMRRSATRAAEQYADFATGAIDLSAAVDRVLRLPAVAAKHFLITIGDRSVSGLAVRDQMVGPWQVPVADCAVTSAAYHDYTGEAMAIGERPPIALLNAPASGRMAVAEALTNIAAARILRLEDIVLSANWMAACGEPGQDAALYDTVQAVSELCQNLGIAIPVGKDSLSMHTVWRREGRQRQVRAPLSVNICAFARVADVRQSLTPRLLPEGDTVLLFIDLARGRQRLAGSALAQVYGKIGREPPDLEHSGDLIAFFRALQLLNESGLILAYHDRSDGGLFVTLAEMAFAGHSGITVELHAGDLPRRLFNEELGAVIQVRREHAEAATDHFIEAGLDQAAIQTIGRVNDRFAFEIRNNNENTLAIPLDDLYRKWASTSYRIQALRDHPECAAEEFNGGCAPDDPGLFLETTFRFAGNPVAFVNGARRPALAILREQGVNGQTEMAAAFDRAGFDCIDVPMQALIDGEATLERFHGLAACGGFSYGDVLGAGGGWAKTILHHERLSEMFRAFFQRPDSFALGICNGCQMLSQLRELIPGADHWPTFLRNLSEQFEARLVMVEILDSPSVLLRDMAGSRLPIVVAHGEGRVAESNAENAVLRYITNDGRATERYPFNPNGSAGGINGFTNTDGRVTIMMPHPERVFLRKQFSWLPEHWHNEYSPWMQLFINARQWTDSV